MKNIFIVCTISFCLVLVNCKKYPEGGKIKKAHKSLHGGFNYEYSKPWALQVFEINNGDSVLKYRKSLVSYDIDARTIVVGQFQLRKEFEFQTPYADYTAKLSEDKKKITFKIKSKRKESPKNRRLWFIPELDSTESFEWDILKLTKDRFIFTATKINNYRIEFDETDTAE